MSRSQIRKAVIPAAGYGTRLFPASKVVRKELFPLVDRDGLAKPAIHIIVEEAVASGVEAVCLVTSEQGRALLDDYFRPLSAELGRLMQGKPWARDAAGEIETLGSRIHFIVQKAQAGYGDAVYCARDWVGDEPFLVMLGDHVYVERGPTRCARQLIDAFRRCGSSVSAVMQVREDRLRYFGTIAGSRISDAPAMFKVDRIVEKPTPEYARRHLRVEGLPPRTYLSFFGLHALTEAIFDCIAYHRDRGILERGEIQLTNAQDMLRQREDYYACEIEGESYDIGVPEGLARAIPALASAGKRRGAGL